MSQGEKTSQNIVQSLSVLVTCTHIHVLSMNKLIKFVIIFPMIYLFWLYLTNSNFMFLASNVKKIGFYIMYFLKFHFSSNSFLFSVHDRDGGGQFDWSFHTVWEGLLQAACTWSNRKLSLSALLPDGISPSYSKGQAWFYSLHTQARADTFTFEVWEIIVNCSKHAAVILVGSPNPKAWCFVWNLARRSHASIWLALEHLLPTCWNPTTAARDKGYFCSLQFFETSAVKTLCSLLLSAWVAVCRLVRSPYTACPQFIGTACVHPSSWIPLPHGFRIIFLVHPPVLV